MDKRQITDRVRELLDACYDLHDAHGDLRVCIESMVAADPAVTEADVRAAWREAAEDHAADVAHDEVAS